MYAFRSIIFDLVQMRLLRNKYKKSLPTSSLGQLSTSHICICVNVLLPHPNTLFGAHTRAVLKAASKPSIVSVLLYLSNMLRQSCSLWQYTKYASNSSFDMTNNGWLLGTILISSSSTMMHTSIIHLLLFINPILALYTLS